MPNFISNKTSQFSWWLNVITVTFICLFLCLSYWQASRGKQKQTVISHVHSPQAARVISNEQLLLSDRESFYPIGQNVSLTGEFDNEHFFLIDNKILEGQVGYYVVMPFKLNDDLAVLVNRGWISRGAVSDGHLTIAPISKTVTITGQLYGPKHNVFIRQNTIKKSWPQFALEIDLPTFEQQLDVKLFPMVVNLHNKSAYSFAGPLALDHGMTPQKHYGYSVQWLIFALIVAGLWIYHRFKPRSQS